MFSKTQHFGLWLAVCSTTMVLGITAQAGAVVVNLTATGDTYLAENDTNRSFGLGADMRVWLSGTDFRSLVRFDNLPGDIDTVTSAIVNLTLSSAPGANMTLRVRRMNQDWLEGFNGNNRTDSATWNEYDGLNTWPGGAGALNDATFWNTTVISSTAVAGNVITFDITGIVQAWVAGSSSNYGILFDSATASNLEGKFHSRQTATGGAEPTLVLDYVAVPEPATLSLIALGGLMMFRRR